MSEHPRIEPAREAGLAAAGGSDVARVRVRAAQRLALLGLVLLILHASLYPWRGWEDRGIALWAWVAAPWPRYWVGGEILANLLAYVPLGCLLAWTLWPRWRGIALLLLATLLASGLSASMESLQTLLPGRVASNVDWLANSGGGLLGALLGTLTARPVLQALTRQHGHWWAPGLPTAAALALIWLLAQLPLQPILFGLGSFATFWPDIGEWLRGAGWLASTADPRLPAHLPLDLFATALSLVGVSLLLAHRMRSLTLRVLVPVLLGLLALLCKAALQPWVSSAPPSWSWLTSGAARGVALGVMLSVVLTCLPRQRQRVLAVLAILVQWVLVNLAWPDGYFQSAVARGRPSWLHLDVLLLPFTLLWPVLALGWLLGYPLWHRWLRRWSRGRVVSAAS